VDRAGDPAGTADQQSPADGQLAFIDTSNVGLFDLSPPLSEPACLGDFNGPNPMKPYPDIALDHKPVAIGDLTREADPGPDREPLWLGRAIAAV
jgi:hypothetical protein